MKIPDLLLVYKSVHRSILDFAAPTYNSLLTITQATQLEQLQRRALKIIYGHNFSYSDCLATADIELLSDRRMNLTKNFAAKAVKNPRYSDGWFPKKPNTPYNTRNPQTYIETKPRTERMKRNPINYMRKLLNNM